MISKMRITLILKILKSENKEINHSIYLTKKYGVMGKSGSKTNSTERFERRDWKSLKFA